MNTLAIKIIVAINHGVEHTLQLIKNGFFYLPVIFFWLTIAFFYVGSLSTDDGFKFRDESYRLKDKRRLGAITE
ncbi:hypothetical protein [Arsenophonus endosymbiont of Aleurodicus floccissimus]|uniref:hypothetical protein n=1 Tax=Arsenophonus endosymbiont of Aleurodicus floccissimus TaxID=2152761 RepID=UPI000E6AFDF2|nr:hypothetical protein [Arsenophonus endosymbiont of Aleurodicus floccissimus]